MYKKILISLFLFISFESRAVVFEEIGTVFSTVATVTDNVTSTTDLWRSWCGNLSDGPCIAATVILGATCTGGFVVGGCIGCVGVLGVAAFTCSFGMKNFCSRVRHALNERREACNGRRELRAQEMREIVLTIKQQHEKEFQDRRLRVSKKEQALFFAKLKKRLEKNGKPDMKILFFK